MKGHRQPGAVAGPELPGPGVRHEVAGEGCRLCELAHRFHPFACRYLAEKLSVRGEISEQFGPVAYITQMWR